MWKVAGELNISTYPTTLDDKSDMKHSIIIRLIKGIEYEPFTQLYLRNLLQHVSAPNCHNQATSLSRVKHIKTLQFLLPNRGINF